VSVPLSVTKKFLRLPGRHLPAAALGITVDSTQLKLGRHKVGVCWQLRRQVAQAALAAAAEREQAVGLDEPLVFLDARLDNPAQDGFYPAASLRH